IFQYIAKRRQDGLVMAIPDHLAGFLAVPSVFMGQQTDELIIAELCEVKRLVSWLTAFGAEPVDPPTGFIPGIARIYVGKPAIVPIRQIHHPIGSGLDV